MGWDYSAKLVYGKLITQAEQDILLEREGYTEVVDLVENLLHGFKKAIYSIYGYDNSYIVTTDELYFGAEFGPEEIDIPEVTQELKDKIDANWNKLGLEPKESKWYLGVHVW